LKKESIAGRHVWNLTGPKEEQIPSEIPPVLLPERFEALQRALAQTAHGPHAKRQTYPLSSHLVHVCGKGTHGAYDNRAGTRYYRCNGSIFERGVRCDDRAIRADVLENAVWDEVCELLTSEDRLLALADEYLGLRETQVEVERDEIAKVERALVDHAVEAAKAGLPAEVIRAATEQLNAELDALRARRAMVEEWRREGQAQSERITRLVELAQTAKKRLPRMTLDERRRVLDLLDVRVTIIDAGSRSQGLKVKIEGVFLDLAQAFDPRNGDAPLTVLYGAAKAHSSGRSHQTPDM
jgi:hypothetical protein